MAIINKDFKIKNGLVVEGSTGTINGYNILTKSTADQDYIIGLIGGETLVKSVSSELSVDGSGQLSIDRNVTDDWYDASGEAATAEQNAKDYADGLAVNYDPAGSASTAQQNAENYADGVALTAENNAKSYADGLAVNYDAAGSASTAEQNAKNYADGLAVNYDAAGSASTAETNANSYTDGEITTALQTAQGYADTAEAAANSYTDGEITTALTTAQGYADTAEANANAYTDNAVSGLNWKQAVNLLSTTPIDISGLASPWPIDGHAKPTENYRVLLTAQTVDSENGIWLFDAATESFSRPADADAYDELIGSAVYVMEGTQYGSTSWVQANHYLTDFTGQSWTQFSGQGSVTAGNGIVVDGLEVSIDTAIVATQTDLTDGLATKQDTLTAGDNIAIVNDTISVTGLTTDDVAELAPTNNLYFTDARAVSAVTGLSNASYYTLSEKDGKAGVEKSAVASTLGTESINGSGIKVSDLNNAALEVDRSVVDTWYDAAGTATTEISDALGVGGSISDAIATATPDSTDDLSEGVNNLYYTDARAKAEAKALLLNADKTNIQIVENLAGGINIVAENGVADSTTDDLTEGSNNLYFTDQRVLDAVSGSDIAPNTVTIDTYRKEEATQQYVASASTVNVHTLAAPYESVKYLVRVVGMDGGVKHSQITEILMTIDGNNNIAITEYGSVYTSTNPLATFSAIISGIAPFESPTLTATTAVNGCEIIAAATMLSWAD